MCEHFHFKTQIKRPFRFKVYQGLSCLSPQFKRHYSRKLFKLQGPIILQKRIRVEIGDTEQTLAERVHQGEYEIYPQAIKWFAEGRLTLDKNGVYLDGSQIDP